MSDRFKALLITRKGESQTVAETTLSVDDLMEGDVTIAVSHSTVNYKDGLALTGRSPVVRRFPMIPGVDLAGVVTHSASPAFHGKESWCSSMAVASGKRIMAAMPAMHG